MVPYWGAMITRWWSLVRAQIDRQGLSAELSELVLTVLRDLAPSRTIGPSRPRRCVSRSAR
ncbi:MAG: hypothetical protein IPF99_35260 [Deltaproteobacteria bacterium]|nr:hypothetical protein [Deltaproteobacteria bacterium]